MLEKADEADDGGRDVKLERVSYGGGVVGSGVAFGEEALSLWVLWYAVVVVISFSCSISFDFHSSDLYISSCGKLGAKGNLVPQ